MKSPKLDNLGRVVIPAEYRKEMKLNPGDPLIITFENHTVMIRAKKAVCRLCGEQIRLDAPIALCDDCIFKIIRMSEV